MTSAELQLHHVRRDGLDLVVHDRGGQGVPFWFQHGLCGGPGQTAEACPSDGAIRLLTLACRGHGASPAGPLQALSLATFTQDLAAAIEQLNLGPVHLGGISMGAAMALRLVVTRPELVRSLVLVRPAWVTDAAPASMAPNREVGELLARLPAPEARAAFEASDTAQRLARLAPDNLASLRSFFEREPLDVTAALLQQLSRDGPGVTPRQVGALTLPITLVGHAQDAIHPWAHVLQLAALNPGATCVDITPKAASKTAYLHDLHAAITQHLRSCHS